MRKKLPMIVSFLFSFVSFSQDTLKTAADEFEEFTGDSIITRLSSAAVTAAHKKNDSVDIYWTFFYLRFSQES
jgi:hypothetical protein